MKCNQIKDINTYQSINNQKSFFLDTNVLYWYVYPRYGTTAKGIQYQAQPYYNFVDKLVSAGNPLYTSIYNISELLNVIEKKEYEIFDTANPDMYYSKKDFRRNTAERIKVQNILKTTLSNTKNICTIVEHGFDENVLNRFVDEFNEHRCDPFDYVILDNCVKGNNVNIISDDDDFSTVENINLFTANETILNAVKNNM